VGVRAPGKKTDENGCENAVAGSQSSSTSTNQITTWKAQLESAAADVFGPGGSGGAAPPAVDALTSKNDLLFLLAILCPYHPSDKPIAS
jgi:hypothetical protein